MSTPSYGIDVPSFHPHEPPDWQWKPPGSALLAPLLTSAGLAKNRRPPKFDYNVGADTSPWYPTLPDSAILNILTNRKFYGQGGQVPTKFWWPHYNRNTGADYSPWYPTLPDSAILNILTNKKFYGQGGQVPPTEWHYDYNDQSVWSIINYNRLQNLLITGPLPFQFEYHRFNYHDQSLWTAPSTTINLNLRVTGAPFVTEGWHYDYNDASQWAGKPSSSALLAPILTAGGQLPTPEWNDDYNEASNWTWQYPHDLPLSIGANPFVSKGWHYDYNDASLWNWSSRSPDLVLLARPFVSKGWHYDYNDAAFWTWRAPQSALLTPLLGGRPQPSRAWHYDYNDQSNWQRHSYRTSLTFISFGNPFVSLGWHYDYNDNSLWTWPPPQDNTLYLPVSAVIELHFVGFHVNVGLLINHP